LGEEWHPIINNTGVFVGIAVSTGVLSGFLAALMGSHSGEIAGALGNILGGAIGALGSAAAVYLMLQGQRDDESEKVSAAVFCEITELCKSPVGQLGACAAIHSGQFRPRKSELKHLFYTPTPIIYPAVADRISRLPCATVVVTFYTQLQETRGFLGVIESTSPADEITAEHIKGLTDLLINQCQLARHILAQSALLDRTRNLDDGEAAFVSTQRLHMLKVLDEQLAAAKELFPNAGAFEE
jgi:hypothetical protein